MKQSKRGLFDRGEHRSQPKKPTHGTHAYPHDETGDEAEQTGLRYRSSKVKRCNRCFVIEQPPAESKVNRHSGNEPEHRRVNPALNRANCRVACV